MKITLTNLLLISLLVSGYSKAVFGQEILNRKVPHDVTNAGPMNILAAMGEPLLLVKVNNPAPTADLSALVSVYIVKGTVVDETGAPMPGVNVAIKGTTTGATTDANGEFALDIADSDATLVLSFMGYLTKEVSVGNQTTIKVSMEPDVKKIDEVVVVGYGSQKKVELTSAISQVSNKQLNELPVADVSQALQGRVAGLTVTNVSSPGTPPDIRIRGVSSVSFATSPLYVIDGFPTTNLSNFDNRDVESVEVLKDASAAAIYGSRATNGVVLITTKKGANNKKLQVNLDTYVGVSSAWRKLDLMTTDQRNLWIDAIYAGDNSSDAQYRPSRYSPAEMNKYPYPGATQTYAQTNTNWQDLLFKTGKITNSNISVSGGGEHSKFYSSAGYMQDDGIMRGVGFKRYNFRINSVHDLGKRFTFGQSLLTSYSSQRYSNADGNTEDQGTVLSQLQFALPHLPVQDPGQTRLIFQ